MSIIDRKTLMISGILAFMVLVVIPLVVYIIRRRNMIIPANKADIASKVSGDSTILPDGVPFSELLLPGGQDVFNQVSFIDGSHFSGIDTIGSSLKNPSYDLRSEIENPKAVTGYFMQSTIDPNPFRKLLE